MGNELDHEFYQVVIAETSADDSYVVRAVTPEDRPAWLEMWRGYCDFYEVRISDAVTDATWNRILALDSEMFGLVVARAATGAATGFANYVVHPFTWSERPACYLEDLFVRPEARGTGAGAALLHYLIALGRAARWAHVYWMTRNDNLAARRLYDRFCAHDNFVRYVMPIATPLAQRSPPALKS